MPGSNAGTGQPIFFVCPVERRQKGDTWWRPNRPKHHVVRTGRTRPYQPRGQLIRTMRAAWEYECDCGHRGWSAHIDMLAKPIKVSR